MPATRAIDPLADTQPIDDFSFADTQLVERLELTEHIDRAEQLDRAASQNRWHARAALVFFAAAMLAFSLAAVV